MNYPTIPVSAFWNPKQSIAQPPRSGLKEAQRKVLSKVQDDVYLAQLHRKKPK